jgi:uncharacterized membrane protein
MASFQELYIMSVISNNTFKQINWSGTIMFALGFWLSGSFVLDFILIPSLSASGMMAEGGFATAGFVIFGIFNRIELVCAALVLTGFLVFFLGHNLNPQQERWSIILASLLLVITLAYTYIFTPQMTSLGLELNWVNPSNEMPKAMISMHGAYWLLESIKFIGGATLLNWCYRNSCRI